MEGVVLVLLVGLAIGTVLALGRREPHRANTYKVPPVPPAPPAPTGTAWQDQGAGTPDITPVPEEVPFAGVDMKAAQVLNGTEARVFEKLLRIMPEGYWVLSQVRLADVVYPVHPNRSLWQSAQNRLALKHVDFAVIRKSDRMCQLVIEVDGPDHERRTQQQRDTVKDSALQQAGIYCIRLMARDWAPQELIERLKWAIPELQATSAPSSVGLPTPKPRV